MKNLSILKIINKTAFILFLLSCFLTGCEKKKGCMYPTAANYDPEAEEEDGSCIIYGCMDPNGLNYDQYANTDDGSCLLAGSGGNTTIVAFPQHHGQPILSHTNYRDTAYVKFNTQEFPGTNPSLYDLTFIGEDGVSWSPENSDGKYGGMLTLKQGLAESVNCVSAFLMKQFGPQAMIEVVRKMMAE